MSETLHTEATLADGRELALTLARLRACAVAGQAATVLMVAYGLAVELPLTLLFAGIGALGVFEVAVWWRLEQAWPVGEAEVAAHFAVDIAVLYYLLFLSGGATNPFISLYVVPVALAAATLSARYIALVVLLAASAYAALMFRFHPLPAIHAHGADSQFDLHVLGMGITFALTAALLGFFMWRLARTLRLREQAIRRERERALRDEGIFAIATQAAGAAHELNTPLSTMHTLLGELRRARDDATLDQDIALLSEQTERCRLILRELVAAGTGQLNGDAQALALPAFVADCTERLRLMRPEVELDVRIDEQAAALQLRVPPGLQHALVALLDNAAAASALRESMQVEFSIRCDGERLEIGIADHGPGIARPPPHSGLQFFTDKRDGLGLGLALATATAERLEGRMLFETPPGGGTLIRLQLPLRRLGTPQS